MGLKVERPGVGVVEGASHGVLIAGNVTFYVNGINVL
jgi:hypothetical protein